MKKYLEQLKKVNPRAYIALATAVGAGVVSLNQPVIKEPKPQDTVAISKTLARPQSQRDNKLQPHRTCNTSSNTMFLDFYAELIPGRESQVINDDDFLDSVMKRGDTTVHDVQTRALAAWGLQTYWSTDGNRTRLVDQLTQGMPVVVNILHRGKVEGNGIGALRGGHIIMLRWYDPVTKLFHVSDPYGNLAKGYPAGKVSDGNYTMSASEFYTRWQGGARYLTDAQKKAFNLI